MAIYVAKIFMNGRSQAVRLPKDFRFNCDEVYVRKHKEGIVISPKQTTWDDFFEQDSAFDENFMADRNDTPPQERDYF